MLGRSRQRTLRATSSGATPARKSIRGTRQTPRSSPTTSGLRAGSRGQWASGVSVAALRATADALLGVRLRGQETVYLDCFDGDALIIRLVPRQRRTDASGPIVAAVSLKRPALAPPSKPDFALRGWAVAGAKSCPRYQNKLNPGLVPGFLFPHQCPAFAPVRLRIFLIGYSDGCRQESLRCPIFLQRVCSGRQQD